MKCYIAYFDLLGYTPFLLENSQDYVRGRVVHILRDIEDALGFNEPLVQLPNGHLSSDISKTRVNCKGVSDTIIFWSQDDSNESLLETLQTAYRFNWRMNQINFPVRGIVVFDEFDMVQGEHVNPNGAVYSPSIMFGKGLASAHEKVDDYH